MKKISVAVALAIGITSNAFAEDGVIPPNLATIITNSAENDLSESQKKKLENQKDILILQGEVITAQRELARLKEEETGKPQSIDVAQLRQDLMLELQAQINNKVTPGESEDNGDILHQNDSGVDGITTVKIEEISQNISGELEASIITVGQSVKLLKGKVIYGWLVKEIAFDSIIFEKDGVVKKLYVPV